MALMEKAKQAFLEFVMNRGGTNVYGSPLHDIYIDVDGLPTQLWTKAVLKYRNGSDPQNYDVESMRRI